MIGNSFSSSSGHNELCQAPSNQKLHFDNDDNESISQFLTLNLVNQKQPANYPIPLPGQIDSSQQTDEKKPKRSPFHNFQKHFVTTLRRNVHIKWPQTEQSHIAAAKQMWNLFTKSKKYTKESVYIILAQKKDQKDIDILEKYNLLEVYNKYGAEQYMKAQEFLKENVITAFRKTSTQNMIYDRRITKKEQFTKYLQKILQEIQQGSVNKRLSKKRNFIMGELKTL